MNECTFAENGQGNATADNGVSAENDEVGSVVSFKPKPVRSAINGAEVIRFGSTPRSRPFLHQNRSTQLMLGAIAGTPRLAWVLVK